MLNARLGTDKYQFYDIGTELQISRTRGSPLYRIGHGTQSIYSVSTLEFTNMAKDVRFN